MYAIEFNVEVKDRFIEIPDYEKFKNSKVKVIILQSDDEEKSIHPKLDYRQHIHPIKFQIEEGERTNPFREVDDINKYSKELRTKAWN
jgi:hypothetical protein